MKKALAKLRKLQDELGIRLVIGGSFPLFVHNVRRIHDLDVLFHFEDAHVLFEAKEAYGIRCVPSSYQRPDSTRSDVYKFEEELPVEMFQSSWPHGFSYFHLEEEGYDQYDGISIWTLEQCRRWKAAFGREKDRIDLEMIEAKKDNELLARLKRLDVTTGNCGPSIHLR